MAHGRKQDSIDWATRLVSLRRGDAISADAHARVAQRLVTELDPGATAIDIGPGAGGMSAALARALRARGGGRLVLVDNVPELLDAAMEHATAALTGPGAPVKLESVRADAAAGDLADHVPAADLVWAARVIHHLPDQQRGINALARVLAPAGLLALEEGGLAARCLPWDLGVGEPGLGDRLSAAQHAWFARLRSTMDGSVSLPVGWHRAMADAGLRDVTSFSFLVDRPPPVTDDIRQTVLTWMSRLAEIGADWLDESDHAALRRLLDPADPAFIGRRDDIFVLSASTVHVGRR